jgi:hypothetical protein
MKIRPPSDHENQPSPDTADLREKPSPGFLLIPLSDQHGRQTTHPDVLTELGIPCCYFKV